jgi:hypothetical protein
LDLETEVERRVIWDARLKDGGRQAFEASSLRLNIPRKGWMLTVN